MFTGTLYSQTEPLEDTSWIESNNLLISNLLSSGLGLNSSIIDALKNVPRHLFCSESYRNIAYEDISLPGLNGGILPSPKDVATAIEMLGPSANDKVLIAGSNAGYCAAIISRLAGSVYLIEETGSVPYYKEIYAKYGFNNIIVADTSDFNSFSEIIAFDRIMIHGAVSEVSENVTERLSIQGNLTFILTSRNSFQQIITLKRSLLGDSISCGGGCYFPEIKKLKIANQ